MGKWILAAVTLLVVVGAFLVLRSEKAANLQSGPGADETVTGESAATSTRRSTSESDKSRLAPDMYDRERATLESRLPEEKRKSLGKLVEALRKAQELSRDAGTPDSASEPTPESDKAEPPKRYATDSDGIQSAILSKIPEIKECYESWLNLNPEIEGRIVAGFTIGNPEEPEEDTATITKVNVKEGGLGNTFLEGCILNSFSELSFDLPPGGGQIKVNYPLTFHPNDEPPEPSEN